MAEMFSVFVETNFETRLVFLLNKDDNVSVVKDKFTKEHLQCFPNFGEINVSTLKVKLQDHHYHLSDSMILSKVFQGNKSEWFVFVDVVRVEEKGDPSLEETLQIQAAEEKTKKRKMKSSASAKKSRKKLAVDPNQSALVDEFCGKEIESGDGNGISMGKNQKTCDENQKGLVDGHVKAMEKDLEKGEKIAVATADVVMIDQEKKDLEKVPTADAEYEGFIDGVDAATESFPNSGGEKVTNTLVEAIQKTEKDGEEAKAVKPKKKTKSRKDKTLPKEDTQVACTTPNVVLALSAPSVEHGNVIKDSQEKVEKIAKRSSKRSKKKQSENIAEEA